MRGPRYRVVECEHCAKLSRFCGIIWNFLPFKMKSYGWLQNQYAVSKIFVNVWTGPKELARFTIMGIFFRPVWFRLHHLSATRSRSSTQMIQSSPPVTATSFLRYKGQFFLSETNVIIWERRCYCSQPVIRVTFLRSINSRFNRVQQYLCWR